MLRRCASGTYKAHDALPLIVPAAAFVFVLKSFFAPEVAEVRATAAFHDASFTKVEPSLKLPATLAYDNVASQARGVEPQARNGNTGQIDMFVLLFTFLSAVTLLMWRHSRRDEASPRRIGRRI